MGSTEQQVLAQPHSPLLFQLMAIAGSVLNLCPYPGVMASADWMV